MDRLAPYAAGGCSASRLDKSCLVTGSPWRSARSAAMAGPASHGNTGMATSQTGDLLGFRANGLQAEVSRSSVKARISLLFRAPRKSLSQWSGKATPQGSARGGRLRGLGGDPDLLAIPPGPLRVYLATFSESEAVRLELLFLEPAADVLTPACSRRSRAARATHRRDPHQSRPRAPSKTIRMPFPRGPEQPVKIQFRQESLEPLKGLFHTDHRHSNWGAGATPGSGRRFHPGSVRQTWRPSPESQTRRTATVIASAMPVITALTSRTTTRPDRDGDGVGKPGAPSTSRVTGFTDEADLAVFAAAVGRCFQPRLRL